MIRNFKQKNNDKGAALMVAVVIIGILMVFTLSLMLVTYSMYSSQNKKNASKRNSEAANSLSLALEKELTASDALVKSALWRYLRFTISQTTTWPYYSGEPGHGEEESYRYFKLSPNYIAAYFPEEQDKEKEDPAQGIDGFPGEVELCMYWMLPEDISSTYSYDSPNDVRLFIRIDCSTASQTYSVTNEYILKVSTFESDEKNLKNLMDVFSNYSEFEAYKDYVDTSQKWTWIFVSRE